MLQWFGLTDALEMGASGLSDERIDALEDPAVRALPLEVILPGSLGENELHSLSARSVPPPDSSSATASRRRLAFFGLRKR